MAVPGELLGLKGATCPDCGRKLPLQVLQSRAGWYLGYFCPWDGVVSRETGYYHSQEGAAHALFEWTEFGRVPSLVRRVDTRYLFL